MPKKLIYMINLRFIYFYGLSMRYHWQSMKKEDTISPGKVIAIALCVGARPKKYRRTTNNRNGYGSDNRIVAAYHESWIVMDTPRAVKAATWQWNSNAWHVLRTTFTSVKWMAELYFLLSLKFVIYICTWLCMCASRFLYKI